MNYELKQTFKNMVSGWSAVLARGIVGLFLVPFLLVNFGKDGYGILGLLGVLLGLTTIADIGLRNALGRELSEKHSNKDRRGYSELISTAMLLYISISIVLSIIVYYLSPWFIKQVSIPLQYSNISLRLLRVYGPISIVLSFITPVFTAALSSHHRFDIVNNINIISGIILGILLYIVVKYIYAGLWSWVVLQIFIQIIIILLQYYYYKRVCKQYNIGYKYINFKMLKPLFALGRKLYVIQLSSIISQKSDPIVLSHFLGPSSVALYTPGDKITKMARPMVLTLVSQLFPLTTQRYINEEIDGMKKLLVLGTKYTILLGLPVSLFTFIYAIPFCRLWLQDSIGSDYKIVAYVMMGWSFADFLTYCGGSQWPVLLGMKKLKFLTNMNIAFAILNIIISIIFVKYTTIGVPGVILATVIIELIRRPIVTTHTAHSCRMKVTEYFRESYLKPLSVLLVMVLIVVPMNLHYQIQSWLQLVLHGLLVFLLWMILGWRIGFNRDDKMRLLRVLKKDSM